MMIIGNKKENFEDIAKILNYAIDLVNLNDIDLTVPEDKRSVEYYINFLNNEITTLIRQSEKKKEREAIKNAEKAKADETIINTIYDILNDNKENGLSAKEIHFVLEDENAPNLQKITSLLKKMVEDGKIKKDITRRPTLYFV